MEEMRNALSTKLLIRNPKRINNMGDIVVYGNGILKRVK
jgi:hypothetical protein